MDVQDTRIVLLGKTGVGKSSLANTIKAEAASVNGRSITLIDAPGFFDPGRSAEELKPEILKCITECAPGPHAFLIVLKVEKFTEHEKAVTENILHFFSEDALKYAAVVFTHGDQLPEGQTIDEFVKESKDLSDLVEKCGGRCHVVDNKYWKNNEEDSYRRNQFQVAQLLNTIDKIVTENNGACYTNEQLIEVERAIQKEVERIGKSSGNMSQEEIRNQAKSVVIKKKMEKEFPTWIKYLVGFTVLTAFLVWLKPRFSQEAVVAAVTTPPAPPPAAAAVVKVVEPVVISTIENVCVNETHIPLLPNTPVEIIQTTIENVLDKWDVLFERIYNPWNPFE